MDEPLRTKLLKFFCYWNRFGIHIPDHVIVGFPCAFTIHVPFACTSTMQKRAFAVVGPSTWNGLPLSICSLPRTFSQAFLSQLKVVLFGRAGVGNTSE